METQAAQRRPIGHVTLLAAAALAPPLAFGLLGRNAAAHQASPAMQIAAVAVLLAGAIPLALIARRGLDWFRDRLRNHEDSEAEQATIRVFILFAIAISLFVTLAITGPAEALMRAAWLGPFNLIA